MHISRPQNRDLISINNKSLHLLIKVNVICLNIKLNEYALTS